MQPTEQDQRPLQVDLKDKKKFTPHRNRLVRIIFSFLASGGGFAATHQSWERYQAVQEVKAYQDALETFTQQNQAVSEAIASAETAGAYTALEPFAENLKYTNRLEALLHIDRTMPQAILHRYHYSDFWLLDTSYTDQAFPQLAAEYRLTLSPEASEQANLALEAAQILRNYPSGTLREEMSLEDQARLEEILNTDFSALELAFDDQVALNQTQLLADYAIILETYPELLNITNQAQIFVDAVNALPPLTSQSTPELRDVRNWLNGEAGTFSGIFFFPHAETPYEAAQNDYPYVEDFVGWQWGWDNSRDFGQPYSQSTYLANPNLEWQVIAIEGQLVSPLATNLQQAEQAGVFLDDLYANIEHGFTDFDRIAMAASMIWMLIMGGYISLQVRSWSRQNWNRHDRRWFDSFSQKTLQRYEKILTSLLAKKSLKDSNLKLKLLQTLASVSKLKADLSKPKASSTFQPASSGSQDEGAAVQNLEEKTEPDYEEEGDTSSTPVSETQYQSLTKLPTIPGNN